MGRSGLPIRSGRVISALAPLPPFILALRRLWNAGSDRRWLPPPGSCGANRAAPMTADRCAQRGGDVSPPARRDHPGGGSVRRSDGPAVRPRPRTPASNTSRQAPLSLHRRCKPPHPKERAAPADPFAHAAREPPVLPIWSPLHRTPSLDRTPSGFRRQPRGPLRVGDSAPTARTRASAIPMACAAGLAGRRGRRPRWAGDRCWQRPSCEAVSGSSAAGARSQAR
jgi:hypothetical protein